MPISPSSAQRVEAIELIVSGTGARTPLSTICGTSSRIISIGAEDAAGANADASRPQTMPAIAASTIVP